MSTTDDQIKNAYDRLGGTLATPTDVAARVARRVTVRRRRRRVAVVGATAVVAAGIAGSAVLLSGGDDATDSIAVDQPRGPVSTLVLTRPDGSTYEFRDVTVSCQSPKVPGASEQSDGERIYLTSPRKIEGDRLLQPFVYFEGVVSMLQGDRTFDLPVDGPGGSESYPMTLFMADSGGAGRSNEVSSAVGDARGTVRVVRASCDPTPVLELEVDATLGSEVEQQTLAVAGGVQ